MRGADAWPDFHTCNIHSIGSSLRVRSADGTESFGRRGLWTSTAQIFRWQSYRQNWPNHPSGLAACKTHAARTTSACSIGGRNNPTTLNQPRTNRDAGVDEEPARVQQARHRQGRAVHDVPLQRNSPTHCLMDPFTPTALALRQPRRSGRFVSTLLQLYAGAFFYCARGTCTAPSAFRQNAARRSCGFTNRKCPPSSGDRIQLNQARI